MGVKPDLSSVSIMEAQDEDADILTGISFRAKHHWKYPDNYYDIWKNELTITADYIRENLVYKTLLDDAVVGFYSIVENNKDFYSGEVFVKKGFWLEHIFIIPEYHNNGIGRLMVNHAKMISKNKGIPTLLIFSDPFAKGFYEKIGAGFLYDSKSSIPGRLIPVFEIKVY